MKKILTDILNDKYLEESEVTFEVDIKGDVITTFLGMGGAITEASSYNYASLSKEEKEKLLKAYYSKEGLNYEYGRISIASNDFSLSSYEYLRNENINTFSISRDEEYIIPLLKDIYKIKAIKLVASPWSPPSFMKTNKNLLYGGKLKSKYYPLYSDYLAKFINTYKEYGFDITYLTIQNEPHAIQRWESSIYSIRNQRKLISHLNNKLGDTKILLWDHNREKLDKIVPKLYMDNPLIAGVGMHWYTGGYYNKIKNIKNQYPNLLLVNTETSCGYSKYDKSWIYDAELYLNDIINTINNGVSIYLDWNILLDINGGPTHKNNYLKSPIIVDNHKIIKTPIYYYLFHLSNYIEKGYQIIDIKSNIPTLVAKKDNKIVIVIMNNKDEDITFNLFGAIDKINKHSVITYIKE